MKPRLFILSFLLALVALGVRAQFTAVQYKVTIKCNVKDAALYIDDHYVGSPGGILELSGGSHKVKLTAQGYEELITQIAVTKNQTFPFNLQKSSCKVLLTCDPPGADILVDNKISCRSNETYALEYGRHEVRITANGYQGLDTAIVVDKGSDRFDFSLAKSLYDVTFTCNARGWLIKVDGSDILQEKNMTNNRLSLAPGKHKVSAKASGYADYEGTINVTRNGMKVSIDMTRNMAVETIKVNGVDFIMMPVKGGTFNMGWDKAVHKVTLSDYYIGRCEVTWEQWKAVMGKQNPHRIGKGDLHKPVSKVTWDECQEFIERLNKLTGKKFRLPTEAEWEYAARGGSSSKGYKYAGSNTLDEVAWAENVKNHAQLVEQKQPNELGIYDMSGNVSEWCQDWHDNYSTGQTNPKGPAKGSDRIVRGGSYANVESWCCVYTRLHCSPSNKVVDIGFRLALSCSSGN